MSGRFKPENGLFTPVSVLQSVLCALLLTACQQEAPEEVASETSDMSPSFANFTDFSAAAFTAMGAENPVRLEYSGEGWEACLGQPWNINEGWARWSLSDYNRVIDYGTRHSYQTALRQAGMDPDKLGGCGAQPGASAQNQQSSVNQDSTWEQRLQITLTPVGFLRLAQNHDVRIEDTAEGINLHISNIEDAGIQYEMTGSYGDDLLLDHIITWIDNPVYGDMPFEALFTDYRAFDGLQFPAHIVQKQGGYATLDLRIDSVIPGTQASAEPPPGEGGGFRGGGQATELPAFESIGEGIIAMHGAYQAVAMAFDDFSVIIDGMQSEARTREIIQLTKEAFPDKPIRYVVNTHAHFDHASGLREFVAEGTAIITHEINAEFYEEALSRPRTLAPDAVNTDDLPVNVIGIEEFMAIDDGTQRLEIHRINGSLHADDMLIAYIPSINTIVEADLLQPWINPVFGGGEHPFLIHFADELERLELDYEQFVPIHRPASPPTMSRGELMDALDRE